MQREKNIITRLSVVLLLVVGTCAESENDTTCSPYNLEVYAGQNDLAGNVHVYNSDGTFVIEFDLAEGWEMSTVHFYVGNSAPGQAAPGQFPYHLEQASRSGSFNWVVPTDIDSNCGDAFFIAMHAEALFAPEQRTETAWAACTTDFGTGWGSYCDSYTFQCGCEDPEVEEEDGDMDCCTCNGGDCPTTQTQNFDFVYGGGNACDNTEEGGCTAVQLENYANNHFADVSLSIDIISQTVLFRYEHDSNRNIEEFHIAVSTSPTDQWPNGFSATQSPWRKIEFGTINALTDTVFTYTFDFADFGDWIDVNTELCGQTFYVAVHARTCAAVTDGGVAFRESDDSQCETAYGLCADANLADSNCFSSGKNGAWAQAASVTFCCGGKGGNTTDGGKGCTLTQGYWKNHHSGRRQQSQRKPWPLPENSTFATCDMTWLEILQEPVRGNAFLILAKQYIAARLNVASGASDAAIANQLSQAEALIAQASGCTLDQSLSSQATQLGSQLDAYNNGDIGPGHCDSVTSFCPEQCFCCVDCCFAEDESGCKEGDGVADGNVVRTAAQKRSASYEEEWIRVTMHTPTVCVEGGETKLVEMKDVPADTAFALSGCPAETPVELEARAKAGITVLSFTGAGCCAAEYEVFKLAPKAGSSAAAHLRPWLWQ